MRSNLAWRMLRIKIAHGRPHLAHPAVTHRSNPCCRHSHISEAKCEDLDGTMRIIEALDPLEMARLLYFWTRGKIAAAGGTLSSLLIFVALAVLVMPMYGQRTGLSVDTDDVIAKMEESNRARQTALQSYHSLRRYEAANLMFHRQASILVDMQYAAPGEKSFRVLESAGSGAILTRVIEPLLRSECETARQQERKDTDISRQNYQFTYAGTDQGNGAYIFMVEPRTANKYLLRGKIWIDKQSFGIMRIEGEPAKSPSFWVRKTRFVHQYAHFGDFWFPISNRTEVELRIFGQSTLNIDYYGYEWQPALMARVK